ncbi:MAG: hypothetical protein K0V04_42090 [Deltaproteobacteria bacterium]|nr:hypothetical protein [Deltaproteobacteria bacterium]
MLAGLSAALVGLAMVGAGPQARPELDLDWRAPSDCPAADVVREAAAVHARREGRAVRAVGRVIVEPDGPGFILDLSLHTDDGTDVRQVRAANCEALGEAAALLLAVAADPGLMEDAAPADPRPAVPDEPVPDDVPEPVAEPTPPVPEIRAQPSEAQPVAPASARPTAPSAWQAVLRVEGLAQTPRILPRGVSGGVGGAVGARWTWLRLELRGHYWVAQQRVYAERPAVGGRFDLWTLAAAGCGEPRWGRLSVPICGGVEAGAMRGRSFGVTDAGRGAAAFVGVPVDVAAVWAPRPRLGLWLGARGVVAVRRPRYHVQGLPTLFRASPAGVRLVAGFEARFP